VKLGQARQQLHNIKTRMGLLKSRVLIDRDLGLSTDPVLQELLSLAQNGRSLEIAIAWTEAQVQLSNEPIVAFSIKKDSLLEMADVFEKLDNSVSRTQAKELRESAYSLEKIIQLINKEADLQVPESLAPVTGDKPKEED